MKMEWLWTFLTSALFSLSGCDQYIVGHCVSSFGEHCQTLCQSVPADLQSSLVEKLCIF